MTFYRGNSTTFPSLVYAVVPYCLLLSSLISYFLIRSYYSFLLLLLLIFYSCDHSSGEAPCVEWRDIPKSLTHPPPSITHADGRWYKSAIAMRCDAMRCDASQRLKRLQKLVSTTRTAVKADFAPGGFQPSVFPPAALKTGSAASSSKCLVQEIICEVQGKQRRWRRKQEESSVAILELLTDCLWWERDLKICHVRMFFIHESKANLFPTFRKKKRFDSNNTISFWRGSFVGHIPTLLEGEAIFFFAFGCWIWFWGCEVASPCHDTTYSPLRWCSPSSSSSPLWRPSPMPSHWVETAGRPSVG